MLSSQCRAILTPVIKRMWFEYIRQVFTFILILLGAIFGIVAVYMTPFKSSIFSDNEAKKDGNEQNDKNKKVVEESDCSLNAEDDKKQYENHPKIVVQNLNSNTANANAMNTSIKFGESSVLELINIIEGTVENLMDSTMVTVVIPDVKITSASVAASSRRAAVARCTSNTTNKQSTLPNACDTIEERPIEHANSTGDDSTIYKSIRNANSFHTALEDTIELANIKEDKYTECNNNCNSVLNGNLHRTMEKHQQADKPPVYHGTKRLTRSESENEFNFPSGQSTALDLECKKSKGRHIKVSLKNSKSPLFRAFRKIRNLVSVKNNLVNPMNRKNINNIEDAYHDIELN